MVEADLWPKYLRALSDVVDRLTNAKGDDAWVATMDCLSWLYLCEEFTRRPDSKAYFERRAADPDGQALGGLIWVRGAAVHHAAQVRELTWVPVLGTSMAWGGKLVPVEASYVLGPDQQLHEFKPHVASIAWPVRQSLPGIQTDNHGRHDMYDQHVAQRPIAEPIRAAQRYLQAR